MNRPISTSAASTPSWRTFAKYTRTEHVQLINCGGDDLIASAREQWNDGSNTLCIAPGKIVVYERNDVTNAILRDEGIQVPRNAVRRAFPAAAAARLHVHADHPRRIKTSKKFLNKPILDHYNF